VDLVWGYTGMLSLGHGVFFGLGAYGMAMYLKLEASAGTLPDFMGWSGLKQLPGFWVPFGNPLFAVVMALVVPGALAAAMGYLVGRSRISGVYFSLLTQALALIVTILLIGQQPYSGGTNGITNFSTALGISLQAPETQLGLYLLTVVILALAFLLSRGVVASRFGRLLVAVRDDEQRVRFCGYDPAVAKMLVLALSGVLAAVAGALFVLQVGIISPAMLGIVPSVEMVIWVAIGGRGTLIGPVLGAILVNAAKSGLSESFPEIWQLLLGLLLVGVVVLFPDGLMGVVRRATAWPARLASGGATRSANVAPVAAIINSVGE
jgi:urea transport system permease protein